MNQLSPQNISHSMTTDSLRQFRKDTQRLDYRSSSRVPFSLSRPMLSHSKGNRALRTLLVFGCRWNCFCEHCMVKPLLTLMEFEGRNFRFFDPPVMSANLVLIAELYKTPITQVQTVVLHVLEERRDL